MSICILCGESLSKGKVNREHYVPQTAIRNFKKVGIPDAFTHALRADFKGDDGGEVTLAPRSDHYSWATVKVHEKCNLDASVMCQDLKWMIDNLDNNPLSRSKRVIEYYAHIWKMKVEDLTMVILSKEELDYLLREAENMAIYQPGFLWLGRIALLDRNPEESIKTNYELHQIILGTKKSLEKIIEDNT